MAEMISGSNTTCAPDEGSEGSGAEAHVALHPEEAYEESGDSLHQPQMVELFGVLRVDLLQAQRRQIIRVIWTSALRIAVRWDHLHRIRPASSWLRSPDVDTTTKTNRVGGGLIFISCNVN